MIRIASVEGEEIGSPAVFQTFSGTTGIETTAMDATNGCVCVAMVTVLCCSLCGLCHPPVLCVALLAMLLYMFAFEEFTVLPMNVWMCT